MPNWKLTLTYDGTPFHGWQVQPGLATVQGTLARAIHHITGEQVLPQGSGRTDAGVHALGQVASVSLRTPIPGERLHLALNRNLPASIRVTSLTEAPDDFHARHSARRKTYEYRIFPHGGLCSPMLAPWVWECHKHLSLDLMQQAAEHLVGTHDFTSFAATQPDLATRRAEELTTEEDEQDSSDNTRTIFRSGWRESEGLILYRVTGSGFLHHMVRNLVGTFVEVGSKRILPDAIPAILAARDRRAAGATAPGRGLFLVEVEY